MGVVKSYNASIIPRHNYHSRPKIKKINVIGLLPQGYRSIAILKNPPRSANCPRTPGSL